MSVYESTKTTYVYPSPLERRCLEKIFNLCKEAKLKLSGDGEHACFYVDINEKFYGSCSIGSDRMAESTVITREKFIKILQKLELISNVDFFTNVFIFKQKI